MEENVADLDDSRPLGILGEPKHTDTVVSGVVVVAGREPKT